MNFKEPLSFEEFREASYESWKAQALRELKKENLESLNWKTSLDISAGPYYDETQVSNLDFFHQHINFPDNNNLYTRSWENRQLINFIDNESTNKVILKVLEGGADGIIILTNNKGLAFEKLLQEVKISCCSISFFTNEPAIISDYLNYCQSAGEYDKISGAVFWSTITAARSGIKTLSDHDIPSAFRYMGFGNNITLSEQLDEIAYLAGNLKGEDLVDILKSRLICTVNIEEDYFQGLALIKAARILFYQLIKSHKIDLLPEDVFVQAFSMAYKNEKYGPHENMLKSTTAAMAAIIGGCNALIVEPENKESPFMQRIAINVSHILKEEVYLGKIMDPSAGSYFIDHLVEKSVKHVWREFLDKQNNNSNES